MLEDARKKGASVFVYLIFSLLIVIFVINFGPQGGQGGGCDQSSSQIISVDGEDVTQSSYHVAYANPYNRGTSKQRTYIALETLIRRELLAQEAEQRGLRVTDEMVMDEIKKGYFFLGGQRAQIQGIFDEDGFWNGNAFRNWVGQLNVSRNSYIQEQERGMLAGLMSQLLADTVQVSRDEALAHFLFENNTVEYDVVAFRPETYRAAMKLTDADVDRFLATHGADVEARYKADERTYKGVKPQLHLRQIFIEAPTAPESAAAAPAPEPGSDAAGSAAAGSAADSAAAGSAAAGSAAAPAAGSAAPDTAQDPAPAPAATDAEAKKKADEAKKKLEDAKKKLEAVRTAAAKDKQKFIDAAKKLNTEEAMKNSAGDLGWRTAESAMLGDKALTDAVKSLKPGEMTPVITTDRGAFLILAEEQREGDLTFDQVKHEIAREMALDVWSKEAAKRAALSALDKARAGTGMSLDQLYEKQQQAPANPGIDIQQILNDPNIPPEQKQKILEMLLKSQGQQGSLEWESEDVPAGWKAQADGAGGSAAAPATKPAAPAAKPAAPADKPAAPAAKTADKPAAPATKTTDKPAAPATKTASPAGTSAPADKAAADKPAAGSAPADKAAAGSTPAAGSAPADKTAAGSAAAGSADAPAAGTPAPSEAAPAPIVASSDKLPEFGEIKKPTVTRFGPAPRASSMPGIGANKQAAAALFDELSPGMLAKQVYEGDDGFVVMQLINRNEPKVEEFDKQADRMIEELRAERAQAFVEQWLKDRCEKLAKEDKIKPNPGLIRDTDEAGNVLPTTGYRPCMSFQ